MNIESTGKFLHYKEFRKYSRTLIETGSGHGGGIQRALDAGFERIISIEAGGENFQICRKRFRDNPAVFLYQGKSIDALPVLFQLFDLGQCVFFLDAHPSGPASFGHQELMTGDMTYAQDTIIRQELKILLADPYRHAFILDDINGQPVATDYAQMIAARHRNYHFAFYDENLGKFYKDKLLVAIPEDSEG